MSLRQRSTGSRHARGQFQNPAAMAKVLLVIENLWLDYEDLMMLEMLCIVELPKMPGWR